MRHVAEVHSRTHPLGMHDRLHRGGTADHDIRSLGHVLGPVFRGNFAIELCRHVLAVFVQAAAVGTIDLKPLQRPDHRSGERKESRHSPGAVDAHNRGVLSCQILDTESCCRRDAQVLHISIVHDGKKFGILRAVQKDKPSKQAGLVRIGRLPLVPEHGRPRVDVRLDAQSVVTRIADAPLHGAEAEILVRVSRRQQVIYSRTPYRVAARKLLEPVLQGRYRLLRRDRPLLLLIIEKQRHQSISLRV